MVPLLRQQKTSEKGPNAAVLQENCRSAHGSRSRLKPGGSRMSANHSNQPTWNGLAPPLEDGELEEGEIVDDDVPPSSNASSRLARVISSCRSTPRYPIGASSSRCVGLRLRFRAGTRDFGKRAQRSTLHLRGRSQANFLAAWPSTGGRRC